MMTKGDGTRGETAYSLVRDRWTESLRGLSILRFVRSVAWVTCVFLASQPSVLSAEERGTFVIITHPHVDGADLDRKLVADAFLKKVTRWSSGDPIRPIDLPPKSGTRAKFSESVLKRSVSAVRSYWQQRIFSGRDVPPPVASTEKHVVHFVANTPGAVGYVSASTELRGVRTVSLR